MPETMLPKANNNETPATTSSGGGFVLAGLGSLAGLVRQQQGEKCLQLEGVVTLVGSAVKIHVIFLMADSGALVCFTHYIGNKV